MNAFVRDGAVNRKRRARQSLSARSTEPERKKIYKAHDYGATPERRDLALSTLQIHSGESSVNQSKVVATEKESRYSNVEFIRAKAFLYLNYKKISSSNVNKLLKDHLKKFDGNETHLKRTFEQCYDLTGSVEKSKAMMKQLATNSCLRLDLKPNLSSGVSERRLSILPCKVVKTVEKLKKFKNKKSKAIRLKEKIDHQNLILFGKNYSTKDKKILYTIKLNDYIGSPKKEFDSDSTIISDDEEIGNKSCMITKTYSLHDSKFNKFGVTKPDNTSVIVSINSNLIKYNPQSNTFCAKKPISATSQLKTSVHKKFKKGPNVCETGNSKISASNMNNLGEINSQLNTDASIQNAESFALETVNHVGQIIVPQLKIDGIVQNSKVPGLETNVEGENTVTHKNSEGPVLAQNIDDEEITVGALIIDEFVENAESTVLETDEEKIINPKLIIDENVQSSDRTILETNTLIGKNIDLELEKSTSNHDLANSQIDTDIDDSKKQSTFETDVEEIMGTKLIIDENVQSFNSTALKTNVEGENTVLHKNSEGPVLAQNIDDEEITVGALIIDEFVENAESTVLETDEEKIINPKLIIDENVQSSDRTILETNTPIGKTIDLELEKSASNHDLANSQIDTDIDDSKKQSTFETDVGEIMGSKLIIDENVQPSNTTILETSNLVGKIIDLELEKSTSYQDLANSQINELKIDTDIDDSEILDHTNLVLKIRKIINTDDEVFKNSIIKDLATYFLNDDFLYKVDALWKTIESELVGELIIKLLNMFNDIEYNMAQFTGCLICIFREIAQKSSILPCQLKLKLIVFLDAIKKYIKFHDNALWRTWFLPSMFFDWCFIVAFIFMNTKNEFKIDFNKSVIRNATSYYKMVKRCTYLFINQDLKPSKSHKKSGIFELTRIDDLLEIDDVHAMNNTKVIPNISINIPSNELKLKKLKTDDNCIDSINHTISENIEEVCLAPVDPKISKIKVRPQFSYSNSFINKLNWFNNNVSDLMKKLNLSPSNESIESSIVQNNTTVVDNNKVPSSVNKRSCVIINTTNDEPTKRKKSKTQVESPRVFFTIANNPREFDITYGSSAITQKSSSSSVSKNVSPSSTVPNSSSSSSTVPNNSISSAAVPQSSVTSTVSQNLSPYYHNYSSSNTSSQLPVTLQTVASRNFSVYYKNTNSNITQAPIDLPSLSNTTQSSDASSLKTSVSITRTSIIHPPYSNNQRAIHHQSSSATNSQRPKAANTWPPNKYTNMCTDPSCSISSTYTTQYPNSTASSYSQSTYSHNIPSATSHPQYSNTSTYPTTYTHPIIRDLLASNTAMVASMNTYMQHQSYNYSNSYSSQNNLKTPDHNTQVSPDLPDARLPNMPNHQAANTINQTCMAANCTNFSSFSCNNCWAAFYCSTQCQKSDWHYHQNECRGSY